MTKEESMKRSADKSIADVIKAAKTLNYLLGVVRDGGELVGMTESQEACIRNAQQNLQSVQNHLYEMESFVK